MSVPILKVDLETRLGVAEVKRFSREVDANITEAIAQAWSKARSAALNVFTAASWDALTAEALPGEAKYHIVSDACDILSAGNKRPEEIEKKADEARQWRSWLAGNKVRCFDSILTTLAGGATSAIDSVRIAAPTSNTFDRDDNAGELRFRHYRI